MLAVLLATASAISVRLEPPHPLWRRGASVSQRPLEVSFSCQRHTWRAPAPLSPRPSATVMDYAKAAPRAPPAADGISASVLPAGARCPHAATLRVPGRGKESFTAGRRVRPGFGLERSAGTKCGPMSERRRTRGAATGIRSPCDHKRGRGYSSGRPHHRSSLATVRTAAACSQSVPKILSARLRRRM